MNWNPWKKPHYFDFAQHRRKPSVILRDIISTITSAIISIAYSVGGYGAAAGISAGVFGTTVSLATALAYVVVAAAYIGLSMAVSSLTSKSGKKGNLSSGGLLMNTRMVTDPLRVIYGKRRVGATQVFIHTEGTTNKYLHMICVWGEGPIKGVAVDGAGAMYWVGEVRIQEFQDHNNVNFVDIYSYNGTADQTVDAALAAIFPDFADAMRYTAYTYFRFKFNQDLYAGFPQITAVIEGRELFDPRDGSITYSTNPALVWRDFKTHPRYGGGIAGSLIDSQSVGDAATWCVNNGYTFNGVIADRQSFLDNLEDILMSFRGEEIWSGGQYKLLIQTYSTPVMSLDERDIKVDESKQNALGIQTAGIQDSPTRIRVAFGDKLNNYIANYAYWPQVPIVVSEGIELDRETKEIELIGVVEYTQALKIAKYLFLKARWSRSFSASVHPRLLALELGDMVQVSHNTALPLGSIPEDWNNKVLRVASASSSQDNQIVVVFGEESSDIYDDTINETTPHYTYNTTTPSLFDTPPDPDNLTFNTGADEETPKTVDAYIEFIWDNMGDGLDYNLRWRYSDVNTWTSHSVALPVGTIGVPAKTGTGTLTLMTSGDYSASTTKNFKVEIDGVGSPNTFKWSDDGGSTWEFYTVNVTHGSWQKLNNGVKIKFSANTGGVIGDYWTFTALPLTPVKERIGKFECGRTVYWQVQAITPNNVKSEWITPAIPAETWEPGDPDMTGIVLTVTAGDQGGISVSWTPPTNDEVSVDKYRLYRNIDSNTYPGDGSYYTLRPRGSLSFQDINVGTGHTYYYWIKIYNIVGKLSPTSVGPQNTTPITATMAMKLPLLQGDTWTNNHPSAGDVEWNAHTLTYNGVAYSVTEMHTELKYIWFDESTFTGTPKTGTYSFTNTHPGTAGVLGDDDFIIATNVSGAHDLGWNALGNELIGTINIQDGAVTNPKILSLAIGKLTAGTITSQAITLAVDGSGDVKIQAGSKTDFGQSNAGLILGLDDSDSDKAKLELYYDANNFLTWDGLKLLVKAANFTLDASGNITATSVTLTGALTTGSGSTINGLYLVDQSITYAKIVNATITATQIANATITATQIANATITTTQISGTAGITGAQIASATIAGSNIAAATIAASNIVSGTITATQIANATITATQISGTAGITGAQIASATITSSNISGTAGITGAQIASATITSSNISGTAGITGAQIASATITAANISGTAGITGSQLASATITAANISGTAGITGSQLASATITGANIASTTITATNITALTITASEIANLTIIGGKVAANTLTPGKLSIPLFILSAGSFTNNSPSAGYVAWASCTIDYNGTTNTITNNNTLSKHIVWDSGTPTVFSGASSPPTAITAFLVGINASGTFTPVWNTPQINGSQIMDSSITGTQLANNTIQAINIANAVITSTQISNSAGITGTQIANNTITATNIANATITATQIASATITSTNISGTAGITGGQIASATITATNITNATITGTQIAATTIAASNIVNNTITATQIANATITTTQISATAGITGSQIASATITATNIANATITATQIASSTITATQIANLTITASQIANATITSTQIDSVTVDKLAAGSITSKAITLALSGGTGDVKIQAGKTDFGDTTSGFILGIDDSDGDKPKFEIGDASYYWKWNGTDIQQRTKMYNNQGSLIGSNLGLVVPGQHVNLAMVTAYTGYTTVITCDKAALLDASGNTFIVNSLSCTGDIQTESGINGLDTGSRATATWYYIWLVSNGTTHGMLYSTTYTSGGPSTSRFAWTYALLVGAVRTFTTPNTYFWGQRQKGKHVVNMAISYRQFDADVDSWTTLNWPAANDEVPIGIKRAGIFAEISKSSSGQATIFFAQGSSGYYRYGCLSTGDYDLVTEGSTLINVGFIFLPIEDDSVYFQVQMTTASTQLRILGWLYI